MPVTCVTAFYAIGRERVDGRSVSDYKRWLMKTLSTIRDPFVVYLDSSLGWKDDVLAARAGVGPIDVRETALTDVPTWKYRDRIAAILADPGFRSRQKHPRDLGNLLPEYCMILHSKFGWIDDTMERNPFDTSHFAWLDAGSSRFYDTSRVYSARSNLGDTFAIEVNYRKNILGTLDPATYIGSSECILHGTMWVMSPRAYKVVRDETMRIFVDEMIGGGGIDNDQITLALAYPTVKDSMTLIDAKSHGTVFFNTFFS